jgi:type VI secretion system protein ImpG
MIEALFREEQRRLREDAAAFSAAHPEVAGALAAPGADPDVDRLLDGVAFLAARLRQRLDALDDELAQGVCAALHPLALRPMPALAVVRFAGAGPLAATEIVPAGARIDADPIDGVCCRFATAWPTAVPPLRLFAPELHPGRIELRCTLERGALPARVGGELLLYAHGDPAAARAVVRAIATAGRIEALTGSGRVVPLQAAWHGAGAAPPLLPDDPGLGRGHGILAEALAWPELGRFVRLLGPPGFGLREGEADLRIAVALASVPADLRRLDTVELIAGCAPAVNLVPGQAEPILLDSRRRDYALAAPGPGEVAAWRVLSVIGRSSRRPARAWPEARAALAGPCWQELHGDTLRLAVGGLDDDAEGEVLSVEALWHDGRRAGRIPAGGLRTPGVGVPGRMLVANLLPPAAPVPAPVGGSRIRELAARLRAAVPARDLAGLRRLIELHDRRGEGRPAAAGILGACFRAAAAPWASGVARAQVLDLRLDPEALGGPAAAWLLGSAVERAMAELAPFGTVTTCTADLGDGQEPIRWPARCASATATP